MKPTKKQSSPSPTVAIIILNWNGLADSIECLESLKDQLKKQHRLFIIDNDSEEDELKSLREKGLELFPQEQLRFLQNNSNLGFAGGNNVGIQQALEEGCEWIYLLNNDTEAAPELLKNLDQVLSSADAKLGIIATKMINYYHRDKLDNAGHLLLSNGDSFPRLRDQSISHPKAMSSQKCMGACAGSAIYSGKMLKHIGLLDEDFFLNYEDSDLSLRGIVQGWECVYYPELEIYHKINASIGKIKNSSYRIRSQRNQLWAYLHNTPTLAILLNLPWIIIRDILAILLSFISLRWTITRILLLSRWELLKSLPKVLKKRRKVLQQQKISSWQYWRAQKNWIAIYADYFRKIILQKKKSVMDA